MYIRTKDGVYEVSEKTKYAQYSIRGMTMVKNADFQYISNENILNQSENLEELCDEFIHKENTKLPHIFVPRGHWTYEECKEWCFNEYLSKNDYELYGAIWTDKGLIYVAKMNDKGCLELL